jgi:hypothetical protein
MVARGLMTFWVVYLGARPPVGLEHRRSGYSLSPISAKPPPTNPRFDGVQLSPGDRPGMPPRLDAGDHGGGRLTRPSSPSVKDTSPARRGAKRSLIRVIAIVLASRRSGRGSRSCKMAKVASPPPYLGPRVSPARSSSSHRATATAPAPSPTTVSATAWAMRSVWYRCGSRLSSVPLPCEERPRPPDPGAPRPPCSGPRAFGPRDNPGWFPPRWHPQFSADPRWLGRGLPRATSPAPGSRPLTSSAANQKWITKARNTRAGRSAIPNATQLNGPSICAPRRGIPAKTSISRVAMDYLVFSATTKAEAAGRDQHAGRAQV